MYDLKFEYNKYNKFEIRINKKVYIKKTACENNFFFYFSIIFLSPY